jgi:hypothetical protein
MRNHNNKTLENALWVTVCGIVIVLKHNNIKFQISIISIYLWSWNDGMNDSQFVYECNKMLITAFLILQADNKMVNKITLYKLLMSFTHPDYFECQSLFKEIGFPQDIPSFLSFHNTQIM